MGFLSIRVYLFILYYALLSQTFEYLLLNNMHCYRYYLLGKGGYVFGSVGLSVCGQHYSKSYERIETKFYRGVLGSAMKN